MPIVRASGWIRFESAATRRSWSNVVGVNRKINASYGALRNHDSTSGNVAFSPFASSNRTRWPSARRSDASWSKLYGSRTE